MGYCISQRSAYFGIKKKNTAGALKAIKDLVCRESHISWVDRNAALSCTTLEKILAEFRWEVQMKNGGVNHIEFTGTKAGDDDMLFKALAPFVDDNSYVEMEGEDGERWKYVFKDGKCEMKYARVTYDD